MHERVERRRGVLVGQLHGLWLRVELDPDRRVAVAAMAVVHRVDEELLEHEVEPQAALARELGFGAEPLEEGADAPQFLEPCKKHC